MRIGILGGGQLGRMLALAGHPLGHRFVVLTPHAGEPAEAVAETIVAGWDDAEAIDRFCASVDVATYEMEHVPSACVARVAQRVPLRPPLEAIRVASDRWEEKSLFARLGIGTAPFARVDDEPSLREAVRAIGLPAVLKTRREGYDGKGQRVLRTTSDLDGAHAALGSVPCILEGFVRFRRELSIVAARGLDGETRCYALAENEHRDGILRLSLTPPPELAEPTRLEAERAAHAVLDALQYVGVIAIELFELPDGSLLANEIAPRVHNTGHATIEGAETSQFEQHLRAITGLPLGDPSSRGVSAMLNAIGLRPDARAVLSVPGAHLHDYGKAERPARKVGHVTLVGAADEVVDEAIQLSAAAWA